MSKVASKVTPPKKGDVPPAAPSQEFNPVNKGSENGGRKVQLNLYVDIETKRSIKSAAAADDMSIGDFAEKVWHFWQKHH